jgi:hypothetical protein
LKKLTLLIILFFPLALSAQVKRPRNLSGYDNKKLHFGFTVGLNTMDLGIKRSMRNDLIVDETMVEPGFQVSIVSDLRLNENFNLRFLPGISFGQRILSFYNSDSVLNTEMKIESSYLDFPLLVKYRAERLNNIRPYLIGGLNYRYDMAAKKGYDENTQVYVRLKPSDLYFEFGFGMDYYLTYFKFSTELRLGVGMFNVLVDQAAQGHAEYVQAIDRLNSYIVMICFHFE